LNPKLQTPANEDLQQPQHMKFGAQYSKQYANWECESDPLHCHLTNMQFVSAAKNQQGEEVKTFNQMQMVCKFLIEILAEDNTCAYLH